MYNLHTPLYTETGNSDQREKRMLFLYFKPFYLLSLTTFCGTAAAGRLFACKPAENNSGGAAYIRFNIDSGHGAVFGASPAFHTTVFIGNCCLTVFNVEYIMRTHFRTFSAPDTFLR